MSWIEPEVFTMVYNVLSYLVPTTFQTAFATKPLPPFVLITMALGGIQQVSSLLEVFLLISSLHQKLFIQIFTELTPSFQLAIPFTKVFVSNIPFTKVFVSYPEQYIS